MLQSIKNLYGNKLDASDGDIGHVKDFLFDDRNWAIRYLVADTGDWLPGRKVILSPYSFGRFDSVGKVLHVKLTRKQIQNSPAIETHKSHSPLFEEEYHRYYGWPNFWKGSALHGLKDIPILEVPLKATLSKPSPSIGSQLEHSDIHLHSTQTVNGYNVRTGENIIGHVSDFMMDVKNWVIGQLVVKTGHRLSGDEVLRPTSEVEGISYDESIVFINTITPLSPVS